MTDPTTHVPSRIIAFADGAARDATREVAVETPVQVAFADVPFAVMMLTPADLVDFAYGFSLTEGVIERAGQIRGVDVAPLDDGIKLRIGLAGDRLHAHLARQRAMTGPHRLRRLRHRRYRGACAAPAPLTAPRRACRWRRSSAR